MQSVAPLARASRSPPLSRAHAERRLPVAAVRPSFMAIGMAAAIVVITLLAFWDARRESASALEAFADEQTSIASAAGVALAALLDERQAGGAPLDAPALLARLRSVEQPGNVIALLRAPASNHALMTTRGGTVFVPAIQRAFASGAPWVRLSRSEAAELGLPPRTAMAGLRRVDAGSRGTWGIAVVASARGERDRELWAQWRLVLSVLLASGLVLAFGGAALRMQRKDLESTRELTIAEICRERDDRLLRADKLASMGALATGIAHEVATPLGVILGRAEQLAARVEDDERARKAVTVIAEQAERIGRVVRGFLTLARGGTPSLEHAAPEEIARAAVQLVEHRFVAAGVDLRIDVVNTLPRIACEPRLFEQALVNLLLNACDACTSGGHVVLCVRSDGDRVAFVVSDDGVGIPADALARATEPFFTTKPQGLGTGLGLAIASEIVKHHQGHIEIANDVAASGRGTRVCIEVRGVQETANV